MPTEKPYWKRLPARRCVAEHRGRALSVSSSAQAFPEPFVRHVALNVRLKSGHKPEALLIGAEAWGRHGRRGARYAFTSGFRCLRFSPRANHGLTHSIIR